MKGSEISRSLLCRDAKRLRTAAAAAAEKPEEKTEDEQLEARQWDRFTIHLMPCCCVPCCSASMVCYSLECLRQWFVI